MDSRTGVRTHLYAFADMLRPRGGLLRTESLSLTIAERLWNAYELWTDPAYRDSRPPLYVVGQIGANLVQEVSAALDDLHRRVREDLTGRSAPPVAQETPSAAKSGCTAVVSEYGRVAVWRPRGSGNCPGSP